MRLRLGMRMSDERRITNCHAYARHVTLPLLVLDGSAYWDVHMLASTAYCRGRDLIRYPPKSNRRRSPKSLFIY